MNKLVIRTALITVAILAFSALAVFSLWILCSPQTMASACERTGNYPFAATCADLRYKYTKNVGDLARCAEDGILSGKDGLIVRYGGLLIADKDFDSLCAKKDEALKDGQYGGYTADYKSYICGHLSAAQYRKGDFSEALKSAEFGDSYNKLVLEIVTGGTKAEAGKVLEKLEGSGNSLIPLLNNFINNTGDAK